MHVIYVHAMSVACSPRTESNSFSESNTLAASRSHVEVAMRAKLQPGETVALTVRKHWIVLAKPLFWFFVSLMLPVIGSYQLLGFGPFFKWAFPYVLIGTGCYLLHAILDRRVNIWVVTNQRLIDEWGIATNNSKENPLDKINDIEVRQTIAGRMMGFGGIAVQTAAKEGETVIEFIENPQLLKETINAQKTGFANRKQDSMPQSLTGHGVKNMAGYNFFVHESIKLPFAVNCPNCGLLINIDNPKPAYVAAETIPTTDQSAQEPPLQKPAFDPYAWKK